MRWRGWHPDDTEPCIRLWNSGLTIREIAETMGKSRRQIRHRLKMIRQIPGNNLRVFTHAETIAKRDRLWMEKLEYAHEGKPD